MRDDASNELQLLHIHREAINREETDEHNRQANFSLELSFVLQAGLPLYDL